jgi:predicted MFS family arabinose efflux permease
MNQTRIAQAVPAGNPQLSGRLTLLLAAGAGLSVASLHYSAPMLPAIGQSLGAGDGAMGLVPTLTQLGYALGILLLSPLGDRYDRRRIMLVKVALLAASLIAGAAAGDFAMLLAASLTIGVAATLAQDLVPAAATLAPEAERGKAVGMVMTGLMLGILLARLISGVVADATGWRTMFVLAAGAVAAFGVVIGRGVPAFKPATSVGYGSLLLSMVQLWRAHASLRRAAYAQALLSAGFSGFWSTLALMLHARYGLGSSAAGAFGLAGVAGALAATLAGRLADRRGPQVVTLVGSAIATVSFAAMGLIDALPAGAQLALIAVSAVGFDFGAQAVLVAHQSIVFAIDPSARSRLNALFFTCSFIGMASGAFIGSLSYASFGWQGVVAFATVTSAASWLVRRVAGAPGPALSQHPRGPAPASDELKV